MKFSDLPGRLVAEMEGPIPPEFFQSDGITIAPDRLGSIDFFFLLGISTIGAITRVDQRSIATG